MKKLIPALCLLLITAALMGTSTFAWFAMNKDVDADGMSVTAKTDDAFLVIQAGTSFDSPDDEAIASLDVDLYPVHKAISGAFTSTNIGENATWGTGDSDDPDDAATSSGVTALSASATFSNYVAKQSFMVGIKANSGTVNNDLTVDSVTITADKGIKVIFVCGTNVLEYDETDTTWGGTLADASDVTSSGVQVDVYIYIDGADSNVYTSNATNLTGDIEFTLTI